MQLSAAHSRACSFDVRHRNLRRLPGIGAGHMLTGLYVMKFPTDVLLIPPLVSV